ncbi:Uncharacterized N-acetyltransferase YoaA [Linum perenne]
MKNTPTITLRPFTLSDADDFFSWAGNNNVTKYCRWNTFTSKDQVLCFLNSVIKSHPWYRAICLGGRPRGELGYALSESYWGKGIATEAVKIATDVAMQELELDRVEGLVFLENKASQKVLEKAGFEKEGILKKYFFVKGQSIDIVVYRVVVS